MCGNLKVTIITVTFNCHKYIERTINSVLSQDYDNVEYIIIDGGSTDGTKDIISKYISHINRFISEPDYGIYDAMNKGIKYSTGDWVIFMNASDQFFDNHVLSSIFKKDVPSLCNIIYGSTLMHYSFGDYNVKPDKIERLRVCMPFCHQSVLFKSKILRKFPYNQDYKITADHDCLLRIYNSYPKSFVEYDGIIAEYDAKDGVSSRQTLKGYRESKQLTHTSDSFFRKIRILLRAHVPNVILTPLFRFYFMFNHRFERIK